MINPFQTPNMPNAEDFQDPLGFVKKLWGDMKIPGMVTPTVSLDELDQQIKDLKAVESWLSLNMNMLRGSIQALEVQRSTIAALRSMGESFTKQQAAFVKPEEVKRETVTPVAEEPNPPEEKEAAPSTPSTPPHETAQAWTMPSETNAWWNVVQDQFKQALNNVMVSEESASPEKAKSSTNTRKQSSSTKVAKPAAKTRAKAATNLASKTVSKTTAKTKTNANANANAKTAATTRSRAAVKKPISKTTKPK